MKFNQQEWQNLRKVPKTASSSEPIPIESRSRGASVVLADSVTFTLGPSPTDEEEDVLQTDTDTHQMTMIARLPIDRPEGVPVHFRVVSTRPRCLSIPSRTHSISHGLTSIGK